MAGLVLPHSPSYLAHDRLSVVDTSSESHPFSSAQSTSTSDDDGPIPFWRILHHIHGIVPPARSPAEILDALDTIAVTLRGNTDDLHFLRSVFFATTWPHIVALALDLPNLFNSGTLPCLYTTPDEPHMQVQLTQRQTACLVVHQFLCTLPRDSGPSGPGHMRSGKSYADELDADSLDLHIWYAGEQPHPHAVGAYLTALFVFLERAVADEATTDSPSGPVSFTLRRVPPISITTESNNMARAFCPVHVDLQDPDSVVVCPDSVGVRALFDERDPVAKACVISANKHPGFGRTASQEEMHVGCSPASWVLKLLVPSSGLEDAEALIIVGCDLVVEMSGYARGAQLARIIPADEHHWQTRTMLFMDALPLDSYDTSSSSAIIPDLLQVPGNVQRELRKAYTAFSSYSGAYLSNPGSESTNHYDEIITGHWGCGSFGGNKQVKSTIQWCAASLAGTGGLRFICWASEGQGDSFPDAFREFADVVQTEGWTVRDVLGVLVDIEPGDVSVGRDGVFDEVLRKLKTLESLPFLFCLANPMKRMKRRGGVTDVTPFLPPTTMLTPVLPPELERMIFELAAWHDRATALKLLLVARRAHIWIEPLLWKVLIIRPSTSVLRLRDTTLSKGAVRIQNLVFTASVSLAETRQLLSISPNITNLALWTSDILRDLLTKLQQITKLTRLSLNISRLDISDLGPAHFAPLLKVSHLEVFGKAATLALLPIFCALPALTHLAFGESEYAPELFKTVLEAHKDTLRVLVVCESRDHFLSGPQAEDISIAVAEEEITDSRFCVVESFDPTEDWLLGAWGGRDFWCRAEERVAERARARQNTQNTS
ncbi:hypothetical protein C8F01DRAFT_1147529 [Mycena amicta]|nr:hypothetical protein C8F01DRAFT_1147529 [Mycena amicta]